LKKIYAISSGDYSDYRVVCLFSSRYKAKRFLEEWDVRGYRGDSRIEMFVLDPDTPKDIGESNQNVYSMRINPQDDDIEIMATYDGDWDYNVNSIDKEIVDRGDQPLYWVYKILVRAKNRKTALKVAQELYMKAKAMNELPDISQTLIREEDAPDWIEKKGGLRKVKITFMKGEK
jgi:hypothetical protein